MNKTGFIKELSEKLGYDEEKCTLINSVIEDYFIIGKSNKEKVLSDFKEFTKLIRKLKKQQAIMKELEEVVAKDNPELQAYIKVSRGV